MADLAPIVGNHVVLSWTVLASSFMFLGVYMRAFSSRSYPRIGWGAYLVVGGALLLGVTFRHEFPESAFPYLEWGLIFGAAFFGIAFYIISTAYADMLEIHDNNG